MADREPHEVLGVARNATEDEVRDAYREMVKEHHPDVSDAEDAEERFVRIRDAYEVMRKRAEKRSTTGAGAVTPEQDSSDDVRSTGSQTQTRTSTKSEHKRRTRERRKRWEDPWEMGGEDGEDDGEDRREKVDKMGYGWFLFREGDVFYISKRGGRGRVYIGKDGSSRRERSEFGSAEEAEEAYRKHSERREKQRRTFSLGNGWRIVENAGGYAVEGEDGYLSYEGEVQDLPYWFKSRDDAKSTYESYVGTDVRSETVTVNDNDDTLASRVTVGAALLPFLATVTVLNILSSSLGLGTKGRNPYLSTALTSVGLGFMAYLLSDINLYLAYIFLFFAVWAGVELIVMIAGPYTVDEIEG